MNKNDELIDTKLLQKLANESLFSEIINTETFKRLKSISFLGAIDYVSKNRKKYNRYTHSISVAALGLHYAMLKQFNEYEKNHLIIAALLHDVGHGPLSHSMEKAFEERYAITHHSLTNAIIKGESKLGKELFLVLKKYKINIDYVIAILNKEIKNETSFALNNPINIDTADGIIRTLECSYPKQTIVNHLSLIPKPKEIIEALVDKNKQKLDEFWKLKHQAYSAFIHHPESIKADMIAFSFAKNNANITQDDFYLTDKQFMDKHRLTSERFKAIMIDKLVYKKRFYFVTNQKSQINSNEDIYMTYKSKKKSETLPLISSKIPYHQAKFF